MSAIRIFAKYSGIIGGQIPAAIEYGAAAAQWATQVAIIKAQKFKEGGQVPEGKVYGPSHDNGGIPFRVKNNPTPMEMEGGEFIIKRKAVDHYGERLLSMINSMKFADGGMIPSNAVAQLASSYTSDQQMMMDAIWQSTQSGSIPNEISLDETVKQDDRPIVVQVSDIDRVQGRRVRTLSRLSYGE